MRPDSAAAAAKPRMKTVGIYWLVPLLALSVIAAACGRPRSDITLAPITTPVAATSTPAPIQFPLDEAPHDTLTEWWYYTGHLESEDGRKFGFEFVIFQTVRGDYPVLYLGQFAVTDKTRKTFRHASKISQGSQIGRQDGFDLSVQDWRMWGALGKDQIQAEMDGYGLQLTLKSEKPPALHDHDGLVSFGPAGDSYYYSHTRMSVQGVLTDHGTPLSVQGQAWFDHQWGNFLVLGGGWDWFSIQLDDGSDLMLNHLRDDQDQIVGVWGSLVGPTGEVRALSETDFTIQPTGSWTSPSSGGTYPMGWNVTMDDPRYELELSPILNDQELVSEHAGPTYWEGAVEVEGRRAGQPILGQGYVELTGYAKR